MADLLAAHRIEVGDHHPVRGRTEHGLFLRLALSCLVDGDHSNSAHFDTGWVPPRPPRPRWAERLARLDAYVAGLADSGPRQVDRIEFYRACREGSVERSMATCEGPVGIGKTTAVLAWLLRRAMHTKARRIIVVAPYTTILSQTAERLRRALVLDDESARADEVVAEHHHRADFASLGSRDLATLWQAPVVLTTSVQFFETVSACEPARLRKLHALPGSAIFLDEAHAALPIHLWRQNWIWMRELQADWGCSFVFTSGSLTRVWENEDIVGEDATGTLPELVPSKLGSRLKLAEHRRVTYRTMGRLDHPCGIVEAIQEVPGPRLVVVNTVQSAAVIAAELRRRGFAALHLSTALCPNDRGRVLGDVLKRLGPDASSGTDWTLVATSLVEAGIDLSFRTAFRERFSVASLIQIGGRVNRHSSDEAGEVIDFFFDNGEFATGQVLTRHPGAQRSAKVLGRLFDQRIFEGPFDQANLVTCAVNEEARDTNNLGEDLAKREAAADYPAVANMARLIEDDTRLVIVEADLRERLERRESVSSHDLLAGSVQLWTTKLEWFALQPIRNRPDVYWWPHRYDPNFLGYMDGALGLSGGAFVF